MINKQYKHKKTGVIVKYYSTYYRDDEETCFLNHNIVENSNDWELIHNIEFSKDWEVLKFKDKQGNEYFKCSDGRYTINTQYFYTYLELLKNECLSIISVKRLKDNKIFKIGDTVLFFDFLAKIEKFIYTGLDMEAYNKFGSKYNILSLEIKKPILVTDDDVEIYYPGLKLYALDKKFNTSELIFTFNTDLKRSAFLYFSTKQARDKYVEMYGTKENYIISQVISEKGNYIDVINNNIKINKEIILKGNYTIYEIIRVSDNEIFKIGDTIISADIVNTIERFEFTVNGHFRIKCSNAYLSINNLKKTEFINIDKSVLLNLMDECTMWSLNLSHRQRNSITYDSARKEKINEILKKYVE